VTDEQAAAAGAAAFLSSRPVVHHRPETMSYGEAFWCDWCGRWVAEAEMVSGHGTSYWCETKDLPPRFDDCARCDLIMVVKTAEEG